jgi:hypothetical protein
MEDLDVHQNDVMPMTKRTVADDRQKPGTQLHIRVMRNEKAKAILF